jgi:hypothetical protein
MLPSLSFGQAWLVKLFSPSGFWCQQFFVVVQEIIEVNATNMNLSQGGIFYIVIQIHQKTNF